MSQVKVVELNVQGKKAASLPPIVHTIRQQGKKQLNDLLQNLFNNTDDALFELADRSQSDQQQEMYFDSMRLIRLHRKEIASNFMRSFYQGFEDAYAPNASDSIEEEEELDADSFSLLEQDELEMTVAVSGIVSKVTSQYSLAVMQLTKRLDFLAKHSTVTERTNPIGPHALSTSFADALAVLEVGIKIRIILMKLFERFVMERLGPVFESANRALIDADVLPDVSSRLKGRNRNGPSAPSTRSATAPDLNPAQGLSPSQGGPASLGTGGGGFGFNTVQSLLAGVRDAQGGGLGVGGSGGGGGLGGTGLGGGGGAGTGLGGIGEGSIVLPTIESNELIHALSRIQREATPERIDINVVPELSDVRSLVLSHVDPESAKALGQADDDTVNFVGMLFDYILNDRNLAIPMKALIGRLQIPIIKLAILDKGFFEKPGHPARALLNELSSAGIGWSSAQELKRDALYDKIESVVLRVLNEFAENPDVFAELLKELREFVTKDSRRSVMVEQRVKESEAGKAKTHGAKLQVQALINQKACGLRLPAEAGKFISDTWSRVMTLQNVKHGEQSGEWSDSVAILDDLLWALQPFSELDEVQKRDAMMDGLTTDIAAGMAEVGCPEDESDVFLHWLESHLQALSANDRAYLEEDERPATAFEETVVEEIVLAAPRLDVELESIEPEFAERIKAITEGTWIEITSDPERVVRCKLATITQPGNNYIFVNRRGMKVLQKNRMELACLLKDKELKLIDESQVFDRALQSVIGNLRQMQRQRS